MPKRIRLVSIIFGATGLILTAALFTYLEFTNYAILSIPLRVTAVFLCPASLLFVFLIDFEPHTWVMVVAWLILALLDGTIYIAVAAGIATLLSKARRSH